MIRLSKDKVVQLHRLVAQRTGGSAELRDEGLLESAVEGAFQTFGGVELYPTIEEKGARLGFSLVSNHAFVDGNKRIGMLVMLTFLEVNGVHIEATNDDIAALGYALADGSTDYVELVAWVNSHRTSY